MYSRTVVSPSGRRTMSRRTSSNLPPKTCAPSTRVSSKCRSATSTPRGARGSSAIEPIPRDKKIAVELRFARPQLGRPVVAPLCARRHRQQDRFGAAARLQAEQRAAIPDEIELDVAAAAIRLKIALSLAVRRILAAREYRLVRSQKVIAHRFRQGEAALESALSDIIEKNPADAARLAAMLEKKIVVAPSLVLRINIVAERRQRIAACAMEMHAIVGVSVIRRQIHATAEPPRMVAVGFRGCKTSKVQMDGGRMRVSRVKHERNAHRLPCAAGEVGPLRSRRRRQPAADYVRKQYAAALQHGAVFDRACDAAAAFGTRPF